jgi:uncharacterized RDD family membrane protein YckC
LGAAPVIYVILLHARYGQTLGKMAMKVKVLDVSEEPVRFAQAVIRSLPQMLPVFMASSLLISEMSPATGSTGKNLLMAAATLANILYFIWSVADIIVCLVSDKKRALHDLVAGTVVVRTDRLSNLSNRITP